MVEVVTPEATPRGWATKDKVIEKKEEEGVNFARGASNEHELSHHSPSLWETRLVGNTHKEEEAARKEKRRTKVKKRQQRRPTKRQVRRQRRNRSGPRGRPKLAGVRGPRNQQASVRAG